MFRTINPARKYEVVERAPSAFEPSQDAFAGMLEEFKLNRPSGLVLNDDPS
jgi:hypothetical protein